MVYNLHDAWYNSLGRFDVPVQNAERGLEESLSQNREKMMNDEVSNRSAIEALASMGLSLDEMLAVEAELVEQGLARYRYERDGRICICGHPVARHNDSGVGITHCKPSRMECPCKKCRPVLEVSDVRPFMRRTRGGGAMHALSLGILSMAKSGRDVKWIVEKCCDRCGSTADGIVPVPVSQSGYAKNEPTGYDVFLCESCRTQI